MYKTNLTVTVCIITNNRPLVLKSCLESIINQTKVPDEVLIVDSSDDKNINSFINDSFPSFKVIYEKHELGSQPILRNIALNNCKTDIICFIDDDAFPYIDWLEKITYAFNNFDNIGAIGGRIIQGHELYPTNLKNALKTTGRYNLYKWAFGSFNVIFESSYKIDALQGTNMCFRTNIIKSIGGFDINLAHGYASFEDTDVCLTLKKYGFDIYYIPDAIVVHGLEPRAKGFSRDMGNDKKFTFSFARNGAYVHMKKSKFKLWGILTLFTIVIQINTIRIFFPYIENQKRTFIFNRNRLNIYKYFIKGIITGVKLYFI